MIEMIIFWTFVSLWFVTYGIGIGKTKLKEKKSLLLPILLFSIGMINLFFIILKLYILGYFSSCVKL